MTQLSAALLAAAVLVWRPPWGWVRVRVHGTHLRRPSRRMVGGVLTAALASTLVMFPTPAVVLVWTASAVAWTAWRRLVRTRRRRRRDVVRDEAYALVDALVAELRSGAAPSMAVVRLSHESRLLAPAAMAAEAGGDVASALLGLGCRPGAEPLADVGRAWAVSDACGAPLTTVLEQVRESAREDRELQRELAAGVAPARATATLVAALPVLGLALGTGLGVDPVSVVLTTTPGAVCVAAGVAIAATGVSWIDRIADRAEADA